MQTTPKKTILIIDDSLDNQTLLKYLFDANGYHVHSASNGAEALSLLNLLIQLPDLILLDANMPVMDGFQFRFAQRRDERLKNIPVVVMSADDETDLATKMDFPLGYLPKPLQVRSLLDNVRSWTR